MKYREVTLRRQELQFSSLELRNGERKTASGAIFAETTKPGSAKALLAQYEKYPRQTPRFPVLRNLRPSPEMFEPI